MDDVLRELDAAFPTRPLPPGTRLTESDDEDTIRCFGGTDWRDHDAQSIALMTHSLQFFSPAELVRFLPAYLSAALRLPDHAIAQAVIERVRPPKGNVRRPSFMAWWSLLDTHQRDLVCRIIGQLAEPDDREIGALVRAHDGASGTASRAD